MTWVPPRDELRNWLDEGMSEVNEEGGASKVLVEHTDATGRATDIFHAKSGTSAWTNPAQLADVMFRVAERHARGLPGFQQFRACLFFGSQDRPSRFLPFGLPGILQFGPVPGGMATEAPNGMGQQQQTMRHTELMIQHGFQERRHTMESLITYNQHLRAALDQAHNELHDCWVAIKELTASFMEIATKVQVDVINAKRNAELLTDAAGLLPAAVNGVTGKNIFPVAAADTELLRKLVKVIDGPGGPEMFAAMAKLAQESGTEGQMAWTMMLGRIDEIRKESVARGKRIEEMAGEAAGTDYANALKDAAGRSVVALREAGKSKDAKSATAPAPEPSRPAVVEGEGASPFAEFGEEILAALEGAGGDMVLNMMRARGRGDLADKAARLRDVIKSRQVQQEPQGQE